MSVQPTWCQAVSRSTRKQKYWGQPRAADYEQWLCQWTVAAFPTSPTLRSNHERFPIRRPYRSAVLTRWGSSLSESMLFFQDSFFPKDRATKREPTEEISAANLRILNRSKERTPSFEINRCSLLEMMKCIPYKIISRVEHQWIESCVNCRSSFGWRWWRFSPNHFEKTIACW